MIVIDQTHDYRYFTCAGCGHTFAAPVACGNRFCDICSAPRRRKIRGQLNAIVNGLNLQSGYGIKHLTLTLPNYGDPHAAAKMLISSFRRLRQRKWFKKRCTGGAWVVEITGKPGSWHVHLHCMLESKYLAHKVLKDHWSQVSPGCIVYIQAVPVGTIIHYLTKYLSKSEVDEAHQVQLSAELRGVRLFQTFGNWHSLALNVEPELFCCPECDHQGFYMNNSDYIPEKYGAKHPKGTLERKLQDISLWKYPVPVDPDADGFHHIIPERI